MSLSIKYESLEDASRRLKNTVVLYEGRPVLITDIQEGAGDSPYRVYADNLPTKRGGARFPAMEFDGEGRPVARKPDADMRKYISSRNFDIAPFPMGYLNTPMGAYYCQRSPGRQQQQGLSSGTFSAVNYSGAPLSWGGFLSCDKVDDMVAGRYPTLREALRIAAPSVAISRDFCIVRDELFDELCFIYHKNVKVGLVSDDSVKLAKGKQYVRESLLELGLRV